MCPSSDCKHDFHAGGRTGSAWKSLRVKHELSVMLLRDQEPFLCSRKLYELSSFIPHTTHFSEQAEFMIWDCLPACVRSAGGLRIPDASRIQRHRTEGGQRDSRGQREPLHWCAACNKRLCFPASAVSIRALETGPPS